MLKLVRKLLPQMLVNYLWHLPMAILANCIYGFPSWKLKVIGITGTDGKTTTVNMVYQILSDSGKKVSMISTINAPGFHVTSPDPLMVQKFAKAAVERGDEFFVLEVTSHGLDQFRFWGIKFFVGVITNITHEHLDYHKTFENYRNTKLKLLENVKFAVINENLKPNVSRSWYKWRGRLTTFGLYTGEFNQKKHKLNLKIPGEYNIENALVALAVSSVVGIDQNQAKKTLENFGGLTGRMEKVPNKKEINIYIDFAHTPNALENVLKTLRSPDNYRGKLIAVIGCEGFRDIGKRGMMGEVAGKLADYVIITSVDPRGQLKTINGQIMEGLNKSSIDQENIFVIDDRKKAINFAINKLAKKDDTVGIFGKGHEKSMNLNGKKEILWSDKKAVEEVLHG